MEEYKQEGAYFRILSTGEVLERFGRLNDLPIDISKGISTNLKTNLITPDLSQAYSLAIQYMTNWFYSKFPKDFFKHKYLDASHVMDQFSHIPTRELIKNPKPSAHISIDDDTDHNRNNVDLHNLGQTLYNNRCRYKDAFFIDREKHLYISLCFMQMKLNFGFNIKVNTKSVQDHVWSISEMAFRAGGSQKHYLDVDYPISPELIGQLACDLHMCNENGKFDVREMLSYFNKHSTLALLYKFNPATHNMEFFLKIPKVLIHIKTSRVQKSQGQVRDMIYTDYTVRFDCEVLFPAIKFFAYYSLHQWQHIKSYTRLDAQSFLFGVTNLCNIPTTDEHGWQWDIRVPYNLSTKEELDAFKNKELISIDIDPLFQNDGIRRAIEYTKSIALSPDAFINIMAFNYLHYIPISINWNCMKVNFVEPLDSTEIHFIIYIDKDYLHNTLSIIREYAETRIKPTDNIIGDQMNIGTKMPNL